MNYYVVLGIDEGADRETIRSAFRGLVRRYHPDAGAGASSDAFRAVVEAYETLNDPARRRAYDGALQRKRVTSSPERGRVVVEPLANRVTAEPMVSTRFKSGIDRPTVVPAPIELDDLFDQLFHSFDAGFWSIRRMRPL